MKYPLMITMSLLLLCAATFAQNKPAVKKNADSSKIAMEISTGIKVNKNAIPSYHFDTLKMGKIVQGTVLRQDTAQKRSKKPLAKGSSVPKRTN